MNEQAAQAAEVHRRLDAIEAWIADHHPGDLENPELAAPIAALREAYRAPLAWHRGKHPWEAHDGYPRHQHSLNGALTIRPDDTQLHFAHGPDFT